VAGETVTVVTTGGGGGACVTVSDAVPDFPAHVAVIVAVPADTPLATPFAFTVATERALLDHVTLWPVITEPWASFTVAVRATVAPVCTVGVAGETLTVATVCAGGDGAITLTCAVPLLPFVDALIVTSPGDTPATTPLALTAASD